MHRDRLDIPTHRQGDIDHRNPTDELGDIDERRTGAVPMVVGTIRWSSDIGGPQCPVEDAFDMLVEYVDVTPLEQVDPKEPRPYECRVSFNDISDESGPGVSFAVRGLRLVGFDQFPLNPHGKDMNGGYILTPTIKAAWGNPLIGRTFLSPLEFTPAKQKKPLTESEPIASMDFVLAPRN